MVYNTGNGASLQKLLDKTQISGIKIGDIIVGNKKKEIKTLNNLQKEFQSR